MIEDFDAMPPRHENGSDPHRPGYHFLPPANWMNDPNGLIQWDGRYHLFYQYNPNGAFHGMIHWGHAVSPDLVHWTDRPIALAPTPGGPDKDGCFSGCAVNDDGVPTLVYTGVSPEVQCVATSDDGLETWQKLPENPIIAGPPPGLDVTGFRDPFVWREGDTWYALLGSGIKDVGGTVFLYRSPDLRGWEYLHPICVGNPDETGTMWECPNFFPLGDRHVLLISPIPLHQVLSLIGRYESQTFTPETRGIFDDGGCYYAPQVLLDDQGRRLIWGWLKENRSREDDIAAGWSGVMSLPRILEFGTDGALRVRPVPELEALRGAHRRWTNLDLTPTTPNVLADLTGDTLELRLELEMKKAGEVGLIVRQSPDGEEQTRIAYDALARELVVDRSLSSRSDSVDRDVRRVPLRLTDQRLTLRVFLDRSVVEIFANDRVALASRVYPTRADSRGLELYSRRGDARVATLDAWSIQSIWRKTT